MVLLFSIDQLTPSTGQRAAAELRLELAPSIDFRNPVSRCSALAQSDALFDVRDPVPISRSHQRLLAEAFDASVYPRQYCSTGVSVTVIGITHAISSAR
jgi:hypothetical protein